MRSHNYPLMVPRADLVMGSELGGIFRASDRAPWLVPPLTASGALFQLEVPVARRRLYLGAEHL